MLKSGNETCAEAAWEFAMVNPDIIIRGGGCRFIKVEDVEGVHTVGLVTHQNVSSSGMLRTSARVVRVTTSTTLSEVEDDPTVIRCPDCGARVYEHQLRADGQHPELGWEYFECDACNHAFRRGAAEVREETADSFESDAEARDGFAARVPNHDERQSVSLGIPNYEAPSFEKQAEKFALEVPDSFP
jgi:hypothetical protein